MADDGEVNIGGKPISSLRVVDLKKECDKRRLSKSGSKSQLVERLKTQVLLEKLQNNDESVSKLQDDEPCQNEFIKQYLQQQKQLIETQMSSSQESEHSADESPEKKDRRQSNDRPMSPEVKSVPTSVEVSPDKHSLGKSHPTTAANDNKHRSVSPQNTPDKHQNNTQNKVTTDEPTQIDRKIEQSRPDQKQDLEISKKLENESVKENKPEEIKKTKEDKSVYKPDKSEETLEDNIVEKKIETDIARKKKRPRSRQSNRSRSSSRSRSRSSSPAVQRKSLKRLPQASSRQIIGQSRSSSSSSNSSRSRSKERQPRGRKNSSSSSSSSSRSRSRSDAEHQQTTASRKDTRSSSSSRSRSRSPAVHTLKTVKPRSRSSSMSLSPSKAELDKPSSSPILKIDTAPSPTTEKEEGELSNDLPDKPVQQQTEVKVTKKISLRRNIEETAMDTVEKTEDGEKAGQMEEKPVKKRKWGSSSTTLKPKKISNLPISTDSLKGLIPDMKTSSLKLAPEPILEDEMDYEDDTLMDTQSHTAVDTQPQTVEHEDTRSVKIQRTIVQDVKEKGEAAADESGSESDSDEGDSSEAEGTDKPHPHIDTKQEQGQGDAVSQPGAKNTSVKKESKGKEKKYEVKIIRRLNSNTASSLIKVDDPEKPRRSPSPARNPASKIIHIRQMTRPFTLPALKELMRRTGPIVDEAFWIDKIKSHCFVTYENEEDAIATRRALHNTRWPQSNPKTLSVDFASEDQIDYYKGDEKPIPAPTKKTKPSVKDKQEKEREEQMKVAQQKAREAREASTERRRIDRERRMKERLEKEERLKPTPVREWDKDKKRREDWDRTMQRSRSRSPRHRKSRSLSKDRKQDRSRDRSTREAREKNKGKKDEEPPAKLLDDLFKKTKTTPCIYWLPLTEQQGVEREKIRLMRPILRQKQGGDGVSPIRELIDGDRDRGNRHRGSVSPPRRAPEPDRSRNRGGRPSDERVPHRDSSGGVTRRR